MSESPLPDALPARPSRRRPRPARGRRARPADAAAAPPGERHEQPRRGVYLLPSLFTIGNMLLGFYAMVLGFRGFVDGGSELFGWGALLIFAAGIVDGFDGRIARLTGTESDFGREYDSLADVITFGVAPALLTYFWGLHELGRPGWLVPLFFMVCCATRLARFNVQTRVVDSRFFVGLPTPAAAGTICSILFFAPDREWRTWMEALVLVSLAVVGTLMVSTFRYRSFKQFDLRRRWSYRALVPVAAVVLVTALAPRAFFLAVAVLYTLSGPAAWLWGRLRRSGDGAAAAAEAGEPATAEPPAAVEPTTELPPAGPPGRPLGRDDKAPP
ncbi:MAG TPA: CDP-diacylglycerol--serine O-phosphatidyltransferase [Thermoanaerobaculia bacterium]|nr:CDP-diacylglycerol--serine O-phosphatidyltransferase [Thermoanaerobaculia bacterium]